MAQHFKFHLHKLHLPSGKVFEEDREIAASSPQLAAAKMLQLVNAWNNAAQGPHGWKFWVSAGPRIDLNVSEKRGTAI